MGSDINGLLTLGMLARQSLEVDGFPNTLQISKFSEQHCTLEDAEKANAITLWEKRWAVFIGSVVDGRVFA